MRLSNSHLEILEKQLKKINQTILVKIPLSEFNTKGKVDVPKLMWEEAVNFNAFISQREKESPYKAIQYERLVDPYADVEDLPQNYPDSMLDEQVDEEESVSFFEDYDS